MINMSAQRAFRSALARADRQKEYSIDFEEITPKILEEIRILLSRGEEDLISYAEEFTERLDEKRRKEVVKDILDKFENTLCKELISIDLKTGGSVGKFLHNQIKEGYITAVPQN